MTDLPHLLSQVFNTPHLIHGAKLETILEAVGNRILTGEAVASVDKPSRDMAASQRRAFAGGGYLADGGIAVMPILGTLVNRGSWLDSMSGMASYSMVSAGVVEMADSPIVKGIMLDIDSFGGQGAGCFDLVEFMIRVSAESGKPIWAVANEAACSAAYAIATAADRIWVPRMAHVGSVGVVAAHVDVTKADQMAGQKWTFIYAGDRKLDFNSHVPLSDEALAAEQAEIDEIYGLFTDLVAKNRGMSVNSVRDTEARIFRGPNAVELGLADKVGTFTDAMNAFAEHLSSDHSSTTRQTASVDNQRTYLMTETTQPVALADARAERDRAAGLARVASQAASLGVTFDLAAAIGAGMTVEAAREAVLDAKTMAEEQTPSRPVATTRSAKDADAASEAKSGWDAAVDKVAERRGLNVRASVDGTNDGDEANDGWDAAIVSLSQRRGLIPRA